MTTEDLDRSDTRRPWTRPTLRRLASGGQAEASATINFVSERIDTTFFGQQYFLGPISG